MKITAKAIRRARTRLLAKAEAEANERKISISNALCEIIERADDPQMIISAFSKLPDTSGHKPDAKAEMAAYFDAAS